MHKKSASYFDNLKSVNTLYYTPDGTHFKTESGALAQSQALEKAKKEHAVKKVTREEVEAANGTPTPKKEPTPKELAEKALADAQLKQEAAKNKLAKLTGALAEATNAKTFLPETANKTQINAADKKTTKATEAVEAATAVVDAAEQEVLKAQETVDAFAE